MSIYDDVSSQMKDAMRAKDKPRLAALRNIRAAFIAAQKEDGSDSVSDEAAIKLLRTAAKQRNESIEAFAKGGRDELAAAERAELGVIEGFLPSLADEATTRAWVQEAIASSGASGMGDMGKVMGRLMGAHKAELNGKLASRLVRELLAT